MSRAKVKVDFGKELFECRNSMAKNGEPASQTVVGKMVGVTGATISSWEHGYMFPTRENFNVLVKVFPTLDKGKYRNAILMDWVNSSGPNNPNPSRSPRSGTTTKPNRVVQMTRTTTTKRKAGEQKRWDTPLTFKTRLQNGKFKSRQGARYVLTRAVRKNIKNSWADAEAEKTAFAQIASYFLAKETRSSAAAAANKYHRQNAEEFRFKLAGGVYRTSKEARRAIGRMSSISVEERDALRADVDSYFSAHEPEEPAVQVVQPSLPTAALVSFVSPPRTELIQFHNITIEAFKDPTGNGYWAQLSTVCDPIGVQTQRQKDKLLERSWAKGKVHPMCTLHSDGSPRVGSPPWYIHSSAIPMWLATMHENNVPAGPIREALIKLQLQLCDVLDRHFHMKHVEITEGVLVSALMECTNWMAAIHVRVANLEDLVRRLVEPPVQDQINIEQAPEDGWLPGGDGRWSHRDGLLMLQEDAFIRELYKSPGISAACEDLGVSIDSESLGFIARRAKGAPKVIVRDGETIRLWSSATTAFVPMVGAVNNWLQCGAPTFKTNGSGIPEPDIYSAFANLNKRYGYVEACIRLPKALKADKEFMDRLASKA